MPAGLKSTTEFVIYGYWGKSVGRNVLTMHFGSNFSGERLELLRRQVHFGLAAEGHICHAVERKQVNMGVAHFIADHHDADAFTRNRFF
jgi:hypothetical protein